jgi:hypothetical protein
LVNLLPLGDVRIDKKSFQSEEDDLKPYNLNLPLETIDEALDKNSSLYTD